MKAEIKRKNISSKATQDGILAFQRLSYEYCKNISDREQQRQETLEKRAHFYFSFISLFLSALILKIDNLTNATKVLKLKELTISGSYWYISLFFGIIAFFLLTALFSILMAIKLQNYKKEYPANIITSLFSPNSSFIDEKSEIELLKAMCLTISHSVEINIGINNKKARWIQISAFLLFISIVLLACIIPVIIYSIN